MSLSPVDIKHYAECIRKGDDPEVIIAVALDQQRTIDAQIADDMGMTADRRGTYASGQRVMAVRIIHAIRGQARSDALPEEEA